MMPIYNTTQMVYILFLSFAKLGIFYFFPRKKQKEKISCFRKDVNILTRSKCAEKGWTVNKK